MIWLITEDIFKAMEAARTGKHAPPSAEIEAYESGQLEAIDGDDLPRNMAIAGDTAAIGITGVLTGRPDYFARFFGGGNTTYREIQKAVALAEADPNVKTIQLQVNSPGGHATTEWLETMDAINATTKPVEALVGDLAASAAYGLVSQADTITAQNALSKVGSVGVVQSFLTRDDVVTVTSSNAPDKRPDVKTEEGLKTVRADLDRTENVFIETIARGRDTTEANVRENFGRGGVVYASEAVEKGMIDGMLEVTATATKPAASGKTKTEASKMDLNTLKAEHPALFAQVSAAGVESAISAERERIEAHLTLADASGDMETAIAAIREGSDVTNLITAKHQAASMKNAAVSARQDEEGDLDSGDAPADASANANSDDAVLEAYAASATDAGEFY